MVTSNYSNLKKTNIKFRQVCHNPFLTVDMSVPWNQTKNNILNNKNEESI